MGEKIIYFGDINNNHKDNLINKAKKFIKKNNCEGFYYILPSGNLLNDCRKRLLDGLKGAFNLNVITFDDIVNKLINRSLYTKIDDSLKETIISNIINKQYNDGKIIYYKNQLDNQSFIKSIAFIIGEIKRSLVTVDKFKKGIDGDKKYKEIWSIYEEYQSFLNDNNLLDNEEVYMMAFNNIEDNLDIFNDLETVIIDEFFDFRPQEIYMIEVLLKFDINIYINIPYKFKKEYITIENTIEQLKKLGFSIVNIDNPNLNYFESLSYNMFSDNKDKYNKRYNIQLFKGDSTELEISRIVDDIKGTIDKGIDPEKIGIISTDIKLYKDILQNKLDDYKIPGAIDISKKMIDIPMAKDILNLIKIRISNYDIKSMIQLIKSSYLDIGLKIDRDRAENILYDIHIKYPNSSIVSALEKEIKNLNYNSNASDDNKYIELLEYVDAMKISLNSVIEDVSQMPINAPVEDYIKIVKELIIKYQLKENIDKLYQSHNDAKIHHRDIRFLNHLNTIFDKLDTTVNLTIKDKVKIKDIYDILKRLFSDEEVLISSGNKKGVKLVTPSTSRGLTFKKVYIIGLAEGRYPKIQNNNWFFNDRNREMFKKQGIDLKNYREQFDKESLLFSVVISRAVEELALSYSGESGSDSTISSVFVEELLSRFSGDKIQDKIHYEEINVNYLIKDNLMEANTYSDILKSIMYKHYNGEDILDLANMYNSFDKDSIEDIYRNILVEEKRYSKEFNEYDGKLLNHEIIKELESSSDKIYSITQLETYGECPIKYYFKYILKIDTKDREVEEFNSMDKGNIYHKVLADYYSMNKDEIYKYINRESSSLDNFEKDIHKILIRVVQNEIGIREIKGIWELRVEFMKKTLADLVQKDVNRLREKGLYPSYFEFKFGYDRDFEIQTEDFKVKLLGKIDRIDLLEDKAIVYDYKTSYDKKIKDILEGSSLQLPVYLMALKAKGYNPIAGGYIKINDGEYSYPMVKEEYAPLIDEKKFLNEEEWEQILDITKEKINIYVKGIKSGDFKVKPTNCSPYCPYKNICRYNKERIQLKEGDYEAYRQPAKSC